MLICILTKNVITSCSVTMMLFLHLEVKPLMTLTTVLYLSCALISGHLAIFAAEGLTKRSAVGFLLRSLIMFQTFISRHNSNFFSDKLVLTSVTPASSAPVLQTPKATSSTLYFDSLTVNA